MNKFILLLLICVSISRYAATAEQKILVLIIASDDIPIYRELQDIWKVYIHLDPEHIEAYFIKADPQLSVLSEIRDDVIWSQTSENLIPGVLNKTLLSFESILPRIGKFSYIVRTNLSSFYNFPRLLKYVQSLPRTKCYAAFQGVYEGFPFGAGAGIILSPDLVEMLVAHKAELWNHFYQDDVAIGYYLNKDKIDLIHTPRMDFLCIEDWQAYGDNIPPNMFHFRVKNYHPELRLTDDLYIHRQLLRIFYQQ
ncbi:MAG: hypothetical protein LLG04_06205 [Parachlamydia sp.]|nr:hypothetical protein [Parachlamydia sp.]